jgi:serine/threonine-protein kinase HipA
MKLDPYEIYVYAGWATLGSAKFMGTLHVGFSRGKEVPWFEFDAPWLNSGDGIDLDPELRLLRDKIYPKQGLFGALADASPDRWGRRLMLRREARVAKAEGRSPKTLTEIDFLTGVDDFGRMGALRFKRSMAGHFLEVSDKGSCPPITDLRALQQASLALDGDDDSKVDAALLLLLRPGGSLGGARPKANVIDAKGALWIAKFPSQSDDYDVGGWEEVTAQLARAAGLQVSKSKAEKLGRYPHHTFLTERFDREGSERRLQYASAMTLLGKRDGESEDTHFQVY